MKIIPAKFRLTRALILFVSVFTLTFTVLVGGIIYYQVGRFFNSAQAEVIEHGLDHIKQTLYTFLDNHRQVLEDQARLPLLVEAVSRPEARSRTLVRFLENIDVLGSRCRLALLDAQGRAIFSSMGELSGESYGDEVWFHQLVGGRRDAYVGISGGKRLSYWQIAVPVLDANRLRGALMAEIDLAELQIFENMPGVFEHFQVQLVSRGQVIASRGETFQGDPQEIELEGLGLILRYESDFRSVSLARNALIVKVFAGILIVTLLLLLSALYLAERLYVRPLKKLGRLAHDASAEKSIGHVPVDQKLKEISALAEDFNWMIDQRNLRESELREARDKLEWRVKERTSALEQSRLDLEEVNNNLELTVQAKTRKLDLARSQMIVQEKLASVGQLAAGVAHELNNPINFVRTNFAVLQDNFSDLLEILQEYERIAVEAEKGAMLKEHCRTVRKLEEQMNISFIKKDIPVLFDESEHGFMQIATIIQAMRDFSRVDQGGERRRADLNKGIEDTLRLARNEYKYVAEVEKNLGELTEILCSLEELNQVFLNLVVNSAHAIAETGKRPRGLISISTWQDEANIYCEFRDNGTGIPQDIRDRIFDPFFTTKPPGKGTGLGLSISYDIIVRKHSGTISLNCPEEGGSIFTISLPFELPEEAMNAAN